MSVWKNEQGSYTLEATVAVPVFLAVLVFLINIIHVTMVYIAMDHAVSETVKLVAAYSYPLQKDHQPDSTGPVPSPDSTNGGVNDDTGGDSGNGPGDAASDDTGDDTSGDTGDGTAVSRVAGNEIARQLITIIKDKGDSFLMDFGLKEIIKKKMADFYPLGNINNHSIALSKVKLINFQEEKSTSDEGTEVNGIKLNAEDIAVVVVYTVKLPVPFLPMQEITLSNTAVERAWTDG